MNPTSIKARPGVFYVCQDALYHGELAAGFQRCLYATKWVVSPDYRLQSFPCRLRLKRLRLHLNLRSTSVGRDCFLAFQ